MSASDEDALRLAREIADAYRAGTPAPPRRNRSKRSAPPRRPGREDGVAVGDVLGELVSENCWDDRLAATRMFTEWDQIVGPEVAQHCHVDSFEDGVVLVRASSTAWATELRLLAPRIVAKLNAELGDGQVLRLDIRGPEAPSWSRGRRRVKGRGPRDTYG